MSDNPLLSKMDALLKKHRGGAESSAADDAPAPGAWLPVLTDVIERGVVPPGVTATQAATVPSDPLTTKSLQPVAEPPVTGATVAVADTPAVAETPPAVVTDTLAEQLMSELAPKLSHIMEKQVAAELRKNLDETVATLLTQLDVNVREIVRDAVAEKIRAQSVPDKKK